MVKFPSQDCFFFHGLPPNEVLSFLGTTQCMWPTDIHSQFVSPYCLTLCCHRGLQYTTVSQHHSLFKFWAWSDVTKPPQWACDQSTPVIQSKKLCYCSQSNYLMCKTCNPLQASVRQCMCVRQAVDTGIINIPVLRKVYFYRISNLTQNKTSIMEFQHIQGEP